MEQFKKTLLEKLQKMKPITKESYGSEFEAGEENGYYSAICDVIKILEGEMETNEILFNEKVGMFYRNETYDKEVIKECFGNLYDFDTLKEDDILFDIGGNIGAFSKRASKIVKKVFLFEPEKENFELATKIFKMKQMFFLTMSLLFPLTTQSEVFF